MLHQFESSLDLPISLDTAWGFFSNPQNLSLITPPELGFVIRSKLPPEIKAGLKITYTVRPLFNLPLTWVTLIAEAKAPHGFTDEQVRGPYRLWKHTHRFESIEGGVRMHDTVNYKLPFGLFGDLWHGWLVKPKIKSIFDFRERALVKRFGQMRS